MSKHGGVYKDTLVEYCTLLQKTLTTPVAGDPIQKCGSNVYSKLAEDPDELMHLADRELHVFPFKDVAGCWRRLYVDAALAKAAGIILEYGEAGRLASKNSDWWHEVVRIVDMALIMTGAPLREEVAQEFMYKLAGCVPFSMKKVKSGKDKRSFNTTVRSEPKLSRPIARASGTEFDFGKLLKEPFPVVITGLMDDWPAYTDRRWKSPDYLLSKTLEGSRLVPVELGRCYTDEDWSQRIIPFGEFLDNYLLSDGSDQIGYLAQHELFSQIPILRHDIHIPDYCYTHPPPSQPGTPLHGKQVREVDEPILNAWLGPAGPISPLHTDPYHNILCQVFGAKFVRLYAPSQSERLYPRGLEGEKNIDMSNTSRVPVEMVEMDSIVEGDDADFPLFKNAEYVETVLKEGECLYIPVGWWHYVRSLTTSFSVSCWWN